MTKRMRIQTRIQELQESSMHDWNTRGYAIQREIERLEKELALNPEHIEE